MARSTAGHPPPFKPHWHPPPPSGIGASAWEQEALAEVRVQKKKAQTEGGEDGEEEGV
jgi:hypothetical protein